MSKHQVTYRVREQDIHVVAVAHTSRRPGYGSNGQRPRFSRDGRTAAANST